jgi:hypothetical protein
MGSSIPLVEAMGNTFVPEGSADVMIVLSEGILTADHKNDVHSPQGVESVGITEVGKIMRWIVEVDVFVVIPAEKIPEVLHLQSEIVAS